MDFGLKGKRALVFGASAGIGRGIARVLSKEGARVGLCARHEGRLAEASNDIGAAGVFVADLNNPAEAARAVRDFAGKFGGIDVLVTNNGGPPKGEFADISVDSWRRGFDGLWLSAVEAIKEALPFMRAQRFGRIILVTSSAAREPIPHLTVSNGLRAGLRGLVKSVSSEVAREGITVNCLLPGYTRTERLIELGRDVGELERQIPTGRLVEPDELGAMAAFLSSDQARSITGQSILVDGGSSRGI